MASSSTSQKKKQSQQDSSKGAYDAFRAVDELVSKPVLGSDGAASWQQFRQTNAQAQRYHSLRPSVAPTAPLKGSQRTEAAAGGFKSWQDERQHEIKEREKAGAAPLHAGYTVFKDSNKEEAEEAANKKRLKKIEERIRPDDVPYFIPTDSFQGWKFDYVFTTRDRSTGYYWDGTDSVKKLKGTLKEPEPAPTIEESATSSTKREIPPTEDSDGIAKKKKKKRKQLQGPVIVDDPNNPLEQVAAALQKKIQTKTNLPTGWEATVDPTSKKTYYYNRQTGERAWERPSTTCNHGTQSLPEGWSAAKDPTTGKEYYYHAATKETRWERPT